IGSDKVAPDGSQAAVVPARRAVTWQLADPSGAGVVRERYWLTFAPGEIRTCTSCHGINQTTQANGPVPTNTPLALVELLKYWTTNSTAVPSLAASQNTNYAQITFVPSARRIGSHLPRPGFHQPGRLVRHCHLCGLEHRADSPGNRDFPDRFAKRKRDHSRPLRHPR